MTIKITINFALFIFRCGLLVTAQVQISLQGLTGVMMTRNAQLLKNLQRFRLITFDITDTILKFRKAPAVQYAKTAAELGVTDVDQQHLSECFKQEFKTMAKNYPNFGCNTAGMTWEQWWIKLVENIFICVKPTIDSTKLREIAETLIQLYRTRECWMHTEGSIELIQKVKKTGKVMGVISNFDPSLSLVLQEMSIKDNFDFILTSYELGVQKPDERIFEIPLQRCNVKPHEALHIGNLYEIDYLGARNSGWSSLLIMKNTEELTSKSNQVNASHLYRNLSELLNALETKDIHW